MQFLPAFSRNERAVGLLVIGAFLFRLYQLGTESIWLDEAIIWYRMQGGPRSFLLDWDSDTQGPTYAIMMWVWGKLFGFGEFAYRFPSAVFGALSVHAIYLLGRRLFGHPAALWAAILAAINPFLLHYSQEARPYTLWLWTSLLAIWFLLRWIERESRGNSVGAVGATIFALYTHPYGPFLLAIEALLIALLVPVRQWRRFVVAALLIGITYLPEAYLFYKAFAGKVENNWSVAAWIYRPTLLEPWVYLRYYFAWSGAAAAAAVMLVGGIVFFRRNISAVRTGFIVCAVILFGMFGLPWLLSQRVPILWMRYTITVAAVVLILLGWILVQMKKPQRLVVGGLLIAAHVVPLFTYFTMVDKDPWREAMAWFAPQVAPDDRILIQHAHAHMPMEYYFPRLMEHEVTKLRRKDDLAAQLPDSGTFWFVAPHYSFSKPLREAMYTALSERCDCDETYKTADLYPRNPYLIFRADIEITRCRMRVQPESDQ